jgi:hypothetical protein
LAGQLRRPGASHFSLAYIEQTVRGHIEGAVSHATVRAALDGLRSDRAALGAALVEALGELRSEDATPTVLGRVRDLLAPHMPKRPKGSA